VVFNSVRELPFLALLATATSTLYRFHDNSDSGSTETASYFSAACTWEVESCANGTILHRVIITCVCWSGYSGIVLSIMEILDCDLKLRLHIWLEDRMHPMDIGRKVMPGLEVRQG
jgi:hypothetical protein